MPVPFRRCLAAALLIVAGSAAAGDEGQQVLAREMMAELVAINTSQAAGPGQTKKAAEAIAARLRAAGFADSDIDTAGLNAGDGNLLAWFRSPRPKARPVLLMAHIDVVDAVTADWGTDPWTVTERDGALYGRGTADIKGAISAITTSVIRLKSEGFEPDRDLILFFTADEETQMANTRWLIERVREKADPEFALNGDSGYVDANEARTPKSFLLQTAEKLYATYRLEARGLSRHSSLPSDDNAIYDLAAALARLAPMRFPRDLNETSRAYFRALAPTLPPAQRAGALALADGRIDDRAIDAVEADAERSAVLRTTCVATRLNAGIGDNVLAPSATATVNCRILPQSSGSEVKTLLRELVRDTGVEVVTAWEPVAAPASPLNPVVLRAVERAVRDVWPKIAVVPFMSPTASDGMYTRSAGIPTYGVRGLVFAPQDHVMHSANEYVRIDAFNDMVSFWYRLLQQFGKR
ncbi:MAG: M20/M25/M40 family metallo-hydrolase [Gammaproteobacteria bacterium]|nr:M20/M25/M40 family metallo-hydrolase [Gammaproteobacteria bacterium]